MRKTAKDLVAYSTSKERRDRDVAQLGAQAKQSISPLKVLPLVNRPVLTAEEAFALEAGISVSQVQGGEIPVGTEFAWTWEYGKSLVRLEDVPRLTTQMRRLHDWYRDYSQSRRDTFSAKVTEEHYIGRDEIEIYLQELFQLYQLDALDLSIVSIYCL